MNTEYDTIRVLKRQSYKFMVAVFENYRSTTPLFIQSNQHMEEEFERYGWSVAEFQAEFDEALKKK